MRCPFQASSKGTVLNVCRESFNHRNGKSEKFSPLAIELLPSTVPDMILASTAKALDLQPLEVSKVCLASELHEVCWLATLECILLW